MAKNEYHSRAEPQKHSTMFTFFKHLIERFIEQTVLS